MWWSWPWWSSSPQWHDIGSYSMYPRLNLLLGGPLHSGRQVDCWQLLRWQWLGLLAKEKQELEIGPKTTLKSQEIVPKIGQNFFWRRWKGEEGLRWRQVDCWQSSQKSPQKLLQYLPKTFPWNRIRNWLKNHSKKSTQKLEIAPEINSTLHCPKKKTRIKRIHS